jgi:hypothetical protein
MGNLLSDETTWPTFESYVLEVAVRGGRVVSAWAEPVRLQGFRPVGVYGADADWVTSGTLARSRGPWVVDDGSLWLDVDGASRIEKVRVRGLLAEIDSGCARSAGRELLWTGDFESRDLDPGASAPLWNADALDAYRRVDPDAAHTGIGGVLLHRGSANTDDVLLTVDHRVPIHQRDKLTLLVDYRSLVGHPQAEVRLGWYNDTRGESQDRTVVPLPADGVWQTMRVDVRVPRNAAAVQPFVALSPPDKGVSQLAVDNVRLIDWDEPGCDYLRQPALVRNRTLAPEMAAPSAHQIPIARTPVTPPAPLSPSYTAVMGVARSPELCRPLLCLQGDRYPAP